MNDKIASLIDLFSGNRQTFLEQIQKQRNLIHRTYPSYQLEAYNSFVHAHEIDSRQGQEAISASHVGALLLAGGVGSRLNFHKPKGCFPIDGERTLYQCAAEKVQRAGKTIPLAIMTSDATDRVTRQFFEERGFFGLNPAYVDFFCQKNWPLLDQEEALFLEAPDTLAMGPNGNGQSISLFADSPIFQKWREMGILHLSLFPVDNPLAEPFYPPFLSHHIESNGEMTLLGISKLSPEEKMGVLGKSNGKLSVIEYSELPNDQREKFLYGNTGMILFSMEFIERIKGVELPIHCARKRSKQYLPSRGYREITAYKFEQFIFDLLDFSERSEVLIGDRDFLFAPLKEAEGSDGIASVQKAIKNRSRKS